MHTPQTPGLAAVQNELLQAGKRCGTAEICLSETAPADRTLISIKLKTNFLAIEDSFLEPEKSCSSSQTAPFLRPKLEKFIKGRL